MWVAPNGDYYPVNYAEHGEKAAAIVSKMVDSGDTSIINKDPELLLEQLGYVRVTDAGYLMLNGLHINDDQFEVIMAHYDKYCNKVMSIDYYGPMNIRFSKDRLDYTLNKIL
jgi:hypothetical protein